MNRDRVVEIALGGAEGSSSGCAVAAALEVAKELDRDKIVVVMIPDTGERYLSKVHSEKWLADNGIKGI